MAMNTNKHELDEGIAALEKIMRHAWDMLSEKDQTVLARAYAFALIRRIADKGMERP
jgi:hypothetical protein